MSRKLKLKKYHKLSDRKVFATDVDDTLFFWKIPEGYTGPLVETNIDGFKEKGIANLPAINHLKKMKARGYSVVVWSLGGSAWGEAVVKALGLENYVDLIMPKIDFHLDDDPGAEDKLGRWQFINLDGTSYKKDKDGNICERKHGMIDLYGSLIDKLFKKKKSRR